MRRPLFLGTILGLAFVLCQACDRTQSVPPSANKDTPVSNLAAYEIELPGAAKAVQEVKTLAFQASSRINLQAIELLSMKQKADEIAKSTSLSKEEKSAAIAVSDRSARQVEIAAGLRRGSDKIVGGRPATLSAFQYQVALVFAGYANPRDGQFCGGALIAQSYILTAAHCLTSETQPGDIEVFAGSVKLSEGGRLVPLDRAHGIARHEGYNPDTKENDIALLKLATAITDLTSIDFADETLEATMLSFSRNATISGWGDTREGANAGSDILLQAAVPIIEVSKCNASNRYGGRIKPGMVCAGDGRIDSCQGDSGGPLVLRTPDRNVHLYALVSWGDGCAQPNKPGVYARIPSYVPWIKKNMR